MRTLDGIQAVTYDCWATLLEDADPEGAHEVRRSALLRFLDLDTADADALLARAWARHDDAWKQIETFGPGRMAAYCLEAHGISDDESIQELTKVFEEASLDAGVKPVDGAADTMARLRHDGIRLGLVCDTGFSSGHVVRRLLEDAGLLEHLEVQCFSDEVGVPKPGEEIFNKALAGLGVRPPEAVHVGDLKRTDIAGALNAGMHAIRFRGVHNDETDAREAECVIRRHEQIFDCLAQ